MGILSLMNNGQIIHGRNLDYDFPKLLMDLVYTAQFYRNGSVKNVLFNNSKVNKFIKS